MCEEYVMPYAKEVAAANQALNKLFVAIVERAATNDWRAKLAYEAMEKVWDAFHGDLLNALTTDHEKPPL